MPPVPVSQAFAMALQHHQAGRLGQAEALYRQVLTAHPEHADSLHYLGVIAHQVGRHEVAIGLIQRALRVEPNNAAVHSNLGEAYRSTGRFDDAISAYHRAVELRPDFPNAYDNLGIALRARGQLDSALAAFGRALELNPDFTEARLHLGSTLAKLGRLQEAIAIFRQVLQLKAESAEAHLNLGAALIEERRFDEAVAVLRQVLQFKPDYAEAFLNLGAALTRQGQLDEAVTTYRRVLELNPNQADAHNGLGTALKDQGELDEAIDSYRRAIRHQPEHSSAHSNLIYALHFHADDSEKTMREERQRWDRQFGDPVKRFISPHTNDRNAERRLRIGYLSPNFRQHTVGMYLAPLFRWHDRTQFEINCYSDVVRPSSLTELFRGRSDQWRNTVGVTDEALAETIRRDGVDILVDLTLHMAGNRLPVFARQAAPVQLSFAGYTASTGLEAIRYRISDGYLEGETVMDGRDEQVCLIDSYWCYDPCGIQVAINTLPAHQIGSVTFGCLNNFCKINDSFLKVAARVLGRVPNSRMLFLCPEGSHRERLLSFLERDGIEAERVELLSQQPRQTYLEAYQRIDIALDPFPYNGHTTSLDALWMGVPVVSLAGKHPVGRAGISQLFTLGLPELVAYQEEEYIETATRLAGDLPRLAELRRTMRYRMEASPLMDGARFARGVETAYRTIWQRWCAETASSPS